MVMAIKILGNYHSMFEQGFSKVIKITIPVRKIEKF